MTTFWIGTADGLFVLGTDRDVELEGHDVNALALGASGRWAVTDRHDLWEARDGGWKQRASLDDRVNCILSTTAGLFIGTSEAHLMKLEDQEPERLDGFEAAEGRDEWYTPWGGPPDVRSLSEASSGLLFANVHVGGILRSSDQGRTWAPTIDIHTDVHEVRATEDVVLAATAQGLGTSDDEGRTWQLHRNGLHATYARAVVRAGDTLLMTVSQGPHGGRAAIYRRSLVGSDGFDKCEKGLPEWFDDNIDTGCLATLGTTVALGTDDGRLFVSKDLGRSWTRVQVGLPAIRSVAVSR